MDEKKASACSIAWAIYAASFVWRVGCAAFLCSMATPPGFLLYPCHNYYGHQRAFSREGEGKSESGLMMLRVTTLTFQNSAKRVQYRERLQGQIAWKWAPLPPFRNRVQPAINTSAVGCSQTTCQTDSFVSSVPQSWGMLSFLFHTF